MIIVASGNGRRGVDRGWDILEQGGTALDAVEAACRVVKSDPADHTVGYGGYPNVVGTVELDAPIMEGATRSAGAVGALRGFSHPITVARAVMERLPRVLVVGDGAAQWAAELGMTPEDLLTEEARTVWADGIARRLPPGSGAGERLAHVASLVVDPDDAAGTADACSPAVPDIFELTPGTVPTVHLVALDRDDAVTTRPGQTYIVRATAFRTSGSAPTGDHSSVMMRVQLTLEPRECR